MNLTLNPGMLLDCCGWWQEEVISVHLEALTLYAIKYQL